MDYQITCICGHRFLVPQEKVSGIITCPACRQRLSPVIEAAPGPVASASGGLPASSAGAAPQAATLPDTPPVSTAAEPTKRCPYCGEVILAIARKCKHCGEFLDREHPPGALPASGQGGAPAAPPDPSQDAPTYALSVSQWDNFWKFLITLSIAVAIGAVFIFIPPLKQYAIPAVLGVFVLAMMVLWYFYQVARHTRVYVRPLRIDTERGILSKDINSLELFRITHLHLKKQAIVERLLGIGTITLTTADSEEPVLVLYQIPHVREVYQYIQTHIPIAARQRGAFYMEK